MRDRNSDDDVTFRVRVDGPFWQLWARTITGINLEEHCMKSLEGANAKGLGPKTPAGSWQYGTFPKLPGALAYYICGVSVKNVLERNAHLFLIPDPAGHETLTWSWGAAEVTGARAVRITPDAIDQTHHKAHLPVYRTCRNWQAAWMLNERHHLTPASSYSRLETLF